MPDAIPIAEPVERRAVPPAGRKFPCTSCGARLDFDPAVRGLKCPYCGYQQAIEKGDAGDVLERDIDDYLDREEKTSKAIPGRETQTRCPGCGAMVLLEEKVQTDRCPFCATALENKPESAVGMIPPESLIPFAVDLKLARDGFNGWLKGLWFAPTELLALARLGQLTGVYLPYWTYDAHTVTFYDGERGDDYYETETYTTRNAQGESVTQTRQVRHTRWYPVSGDVTHFFDDVLVQASKSIPADLMGDASPWRLGKLEPFRPDYLSGFRTERYAVSLKEGLGNAKRIMQPYIDRLVRQDIGGDHQRVHSQKTRYSAVTFKPILLPLWVAVYRYHDKTYQVLVNGQTGKVTGYRPYSWMKIVRMIVLVLLLIGTIVTGVLWLTGK